MENAETIAQGIAFFPGDCLAVLPTIAAESVDSCVCDPPYHLTSIVKRFGETSQADETQTSDRARRGADGMARLSRGFMGKQWDGGDVAFRVETWLAVWRVLKPGAHLIAFSGTRTYHRMVCAIEDAGFEVRDQIGWAYGSGFPKSHNQKGEWEGWGTALKPAWEPIVLARKPLIGTVAQNIEAHGTGAININGCRIPTEENLNGGAYTGSQRHDGVENWRFKNGGARQPMPGDEREGAALGMFQPGKTVGKEYEQPPGRWPANIVHDGSDEVVGAFPETHSAGAARDEPFDGNHEGGNGWGNIGVGRKGARIGDDGGSAARFFYTAKADQDDRLGSKHPTVKPLDLMQWLVRLVTPPGGVVLDPFAGTGTTGEAAFREGFRSILIEREPEYQEDIRRRMKLLLGGPEERKRAAIKERMKDQPADHGPLFSV